MISYKRFPWKIFLRFFISQWFVYNLLFVAVLMLADIENSVSSEIFRKMLAAYMSASMFLAALVAYQFVRPLQKIILKALRISSKKTSKEVGLNNEDFLNEELGEFTQLETALNRIARKLKKKKEQLVREREENQAFMSSVHEGLISISPDEKLLYFNSQFAAQFINPSEMSLIPGSLSMTTIFRAPEVSEGFRSALRDGKDNKITTKLAVLVDNQPRFFAISIAPLRKAKSREIYGAIGIFHDITEIKKAEQIRIEFVGNASHELRTPLTSVKGYLETLKGDFLAGNLEQVGGFLDIVSNNVDRLIELVNDLLSISALDNNAELHLEQVIPLQISEQVISELQVIAEEKNQVIRVTGDIPSFMADARKVEQVLRNLVSNAMKYITARGSIHISWDSNPAGDIILKVKDDGPGIPSEHHSRLFERFYRVDKGRGRDGGGTGLGLAIVKHIMQNHGGTVQIVSDVDKGAEFICIFPRLAAKK